MVGTTFCGTRLTMELVPDILQHMGKGARSLECPEEAILRRMSGVDVKLLDKELLSLSHTLSRAGSSACRFRAQFLKLLLIKGVNRSRKRRSPESRRASSCHVQPRFPEVGATSYGTAPEDPGTCIPGGGASGPSPKPGRAVCLPVVELTSSLAAAIQGSPRP